MKIRFDWARSARFIPCVHLTTTELEPVPYTTDECTPKRQLQPSCKNNTRKLWRWTSERWFFCCWNRRISNLRVAIVDPCHCWLKFPLHGHSPMVRSLFCDWWNRGFRNLGGFAALLNPKGCQWNRFFHMPHPALRHVIVMLPSLMFLMGKYCIFFAPRRGNNTQQAGPLSLWD